MTPSDASTANNRRRSERVPFAAVVHYHMAGSEFINLSSNISQEGIFIRNFAPPPVGSELRIKVRLPSEQGGVPVQLIGRVVRVAAGDDAQDRGMGVEFISVQAESLQAIRFFVDRIYGKGAPEDLDVQQNNAGRFEYKPSPRDVLSLRPVDGPGGQPGEAGALGRKLVWAALLILVGILFGGGIVFLIFLAS